MNGEFGDVTVDVTPDHIGTIRLHRPPANYFDAELLESLLTSMAAAENAGARALVLTSEGKHFCAGANFAGGGAASGVSGELYARAVELFRQPLPVVAAVQGRAIGGGLGLALAADFRVVSAESRLEANFSRLGLHHGFGISVTLPAVVGQQAAADLLLTGRSVLGEEAVAIGLADWLGPSDGLVTLAQTKARDIAAAAPLAVRAIRNTLREGLAERVAEATRKELAKQLILGKTGDFREGVRAARERRPPQFTGD